MCFLNNSPTPLGGGGGLGDVRSCIQYIKFTQHPGKLSLDYSPAPGLGEYAFAGVYACVVPYWGVPPGPLKV
jgi:hypothetical protein